MLLLLLLFSGVVMVIEEEGVYLADFIGDIGPFMAASFADVDNHFNFVGAGLDGFVGFEEFACCRASAMRKTNYSTDFDGRVREVKAGFAHQRWCYAR